MAMTMPTSQQQQARLAGPLPFDYAPNAHDQPAFSNPWLPAASPPSAVYMAGQQAPNLSQSIMAANQHPNQHHPKQHHGRASTSSASPMAYSSLPVGPSSSTDLLAMSRLHSTSASFADAAYTTSASAVGSHFSHPSTMAHASMPHPSTAPYDAVGYTPASRQSSTPFGVSPDDNPARRLSQHQNLRAHDEERRSFADALDASHGMLAMSQDTPRNIYGSRSDRSSVDSYGFPSTHSTSSSMSSASNGSFGSYYGDSVSDYSTAGSDIESVTSRTMPRPSGLMSAHIPPAPKSMMSQFNSKVPSANQKKHKCKVCDKCFTRPSSLQTHMYSHTGEKPFTCEVEGCGRQFSVVSNLRRHRKVHRGDARSEAGSEDHHSE